METKPWAAFSSQRAHSTQQQANSSFCHEEPGEGGAEGSPFICLFVCFCFEAWVSPALSFLELALLDQAGLELRDSPVSASSVLGLKACATTAQLGSNTLEATLCLNF